MSDKLENVVDEVMEETEVKTSETVEETAQEVVQEVEETAETVQETAEEETNEQPIEDIVDEASEAIEAVANGDDDAAEVVGELREDVEVAVEEILPTENKKKSVAPIIAVVVVLAVLIVGIAAWLGFGGVFNKYNDVTISIYGYTLEDMAKSNSMTVEEFKTTSGLPKDMPASTNYEAAIYYTPVGKYAQLYFGMDFETFKEQVYFPEKITVSEPKNFIEKVKNIFNPQKEEEITADTPWGKVLDEFKLGDYVIEGQFDAFKEYYGFDDTITTETLYKEVRERVEQKDYEVYQEQMKMMEAQQESVETTEEEQPADGTEDTEQTNTETAQESVEETPVEE